MKQISNLNLNQISLYENIKYLDIADSNVTLSISQTSVFYLTINVPQVNINCSLSNLNLNNKFVNSLIFLYNATNTYSRINTSRNFIWNTYNVEEDFIVLYPKGEVSLGLSTFNSGLFWLVTPHSVIYNAYMYSTHPNISIPTITNSFDESSQTYLLNTNFNFTISPFTANNCTDSLELLNVTIYLDPDLTNRVLLKNIVPANNIVDLSPYLLSKDVLYYVQLRYVGKEYYSDISDPFPIKFIN